MRSRNGISKALTSAAYLINRVPSRSVDFWTPLQALSLHVDALAVPNLPPHVFGCVAFVHLHKQQRSKLEPRALRCMFVGYASNQKGYRCYHPPTTKLFVTVDVAFHENDMYFAHYESALQGENKTEVQTLDYTIPDVNHLSLSGDVLETSGDDSQKHNDVNHLDLSGDVLETSGDDSQENNDVNDWELSGNALELSGDYSHENDVDESTSSENSLPSSPLDNSLTATSQSVSPPLSPNNHNQSFFIPDTLPPHRLPNRVNRGIPKLTYEVDPKCKTRRNGKLTALIVYVDDMVVTGNDPEERTALQGYLYTKFEMKDLRS
ncbi:hypothetical protein ACFX2I_006230 [Malus domestica]